MSTLDQAFFRAYKRQSATPVATPLDCLRPPVLMDAGPASALEEHPTQRTADVSAEAVRNDVMEALENEPAASVHEDWADAEPSGQTVRETAGEAPPFEQLGLGVVYRVDQGVPAQHPSKLAAEPAAKGAAPFRPVLQVDGFSWPKACRRLGKAAPDELDRLADALVSAMLRGHKVLAIGGCGAGDGATTMVLCAARWLAERGHKVLMADAKAADPKLAGRLGILAQHGWEEVLAGQLPLGEAVIETVRGDLAVLPLGASLADADQSDEYEMRLKENLDTLAAYYDLVLIDLGSLADPEISGGPMVRGITPRLDAIAVVHDVRAASMDAGGRDRLADVQRFLATTDVVQLGIIENFVCTNLTGS